MQKKDRREQEAQLNIVQEAAVEVAEAENAHTVMELVKNW